MKSFREIKFRSWDIYNEVMTYGIDLYFYNGKLEQIRHDDFETESDAPNATPSGNVEASEFELMQYIGLKDKNGKEIYVGDIIKKTHDNLRGNYEMKPSQVGDLFVVVLMEPGYVLVPIDSYTNTDFNTDTPNVWGYIHQYELWNGGEVSREVIGNKFENKELLEVK